MSQSDESRIKCDLCNVSLPKSKDDVTNKDSFEMHLKSKKHQKALLHDQKNERSLFVAGITRKFNATHLRNHFKQFGPVKGVLLKRHFAMVELEDVTTRDVILKESEHTVLGVKLRVEPRLPAHQSTRSKSRNEGVIAAQQNKSQEIKDLMEIGELSDQVDHVTEEYVLTEEELTFRETLRVNIENALRSFVPEVGLRMYGSTDSGLGMKGCDLDLMVDLNAYTNISEDVRKQVKPLERKSLQSLEYIDEIVTHASLSSAEIPVQVIYFLIALKTTPDLGLGNFRPIPHARVPLLRVLHREQNVECDLTFGSGLALHNTNLIKLLLALDVRMQPLVLIVRFWAKHVDLQSGNPAHSISGYTLTMMVYIFLQNTQPPVLPSLDALSALSAQKIELGGWDCTFCNDPQLIMKRLLRRKNNQTVVQLLQGFFEFYANLDWFRMVLCARTGKVMDALEFKRVFKTAEKTANFRMNMVALQDPFDLSHNTMGSVDIATAKHMSLMLMRAAAAIQEHQADWSLMTIVPDPPIYKKFHEKEDLRALIFRFVPSLLPSSLCALDNCIKAEKQWHVWFIGHLLMCLDFLQVDYEIIDDEDFEAETMRAQSNSAMAAKPVAGHATRNRIQQAKKPSPKKGQVAVKAAQDEVVQGPKTGPLRFSATKILKRQTTYQCIGFCRMWQGREHLSRQMDEGPLKEEDIFTKEEKISEQILENLQERDQCYTDPILYCNMVVSRYSIGHETKIEVTLENGLKRDFNAFVTFFPRYVRKMMRAASML